MRDARFCGGPWDGQVRATPLWWQPRLYVRQGGAVHVYRRSAAITRDPETSGAVIGVVFDYAGEYA